MNAISECKIASVSARQIFDSRGTPTVEATVLLQNGEAAYASVPSGASTGEHEAVELRDGGLAYGGKGVTKAVESVNDPIRKALIGKRADCLESIDRILCELDGTPNKSVLGANAILAVSLATAKAAAKYYSLPLYRYLGGSNARILPIPMMNILNGGAHASNNLDVQEFMIMPVGAASFAEAMQMGTEIYGALKSLLKSDGLSIAVGDEGGFAPNLEGDEAALDYILRAVEKAGYLPGDDVRIALDIASSEWFEGGKYKLPKSGKEMSVDALMGYYHKLLAKYPIASIEDPFAEDDWDAFSKFTESRPDVQIVGDDLFVTNTVRLREGIKRGAANAILIKPNQIGTLTETMEAMTLAASRGYAAIASHRSGETEDTTIADLAVATGCGQIKTGAPARSERVCKYNRLLRIEHCLGDSALYGLMK